MTGLQWERKGRAGTTKTRLLVETSARVPLSISPPAHSWDDTPVARSGVERVLVKAVPYSPDTRNLSALPVKSGRVLSIPTRYAFAEFSLARYLGADLTYIKLTVNCLQRRSAWFSNPSGDFMTAQVCRVIMKSSLPVRPPICVLGYFISLIKLLLPQKSLRLGRLQGL